MRTAIIIAAMIAAQPASACHRFSRWYYPYAQRCAVATQPPGKTWAVEITKLPPSWTLDDRAFGIEALKKELAK